MSGYTDSAAGLLVQAADALDPAQAVAIQNALPVADLAGLRQQVDTAQGLINSAGGKPASELAPFILGTYMAIDELQAKLVALQTDVDALVGTFQHASDGCRTEAQHYAGGA